MENIQERITAARRELRAALRAKKTAPKIYNYDEVNDDTYEYPDVAEAVKDSVKLSLRYDKSPYITSTSGSSSHFLGDTTTLKTIPPYIVTEVYNVRDCTRAANTVEITYDTRGNVAYLSKGLAELRRQLYDLSVKLIKEQQKEMSLEEANNMPF